MRHIVSHHHACATLTYIRDLIQRRVVWHLSHVCEEQVATDEIVADGDGTHTG